LILDEDFDRKEAYYGFREALSSLTPGGIVGGRGVVLDDDVDADGNPWGHLWMQPEPEEDRSGNDKEGDARPDWEQPDSQTTDPAEPRSRRSQGSIRAEVV